MRALPWWASVLKNRSSSFSEPYPDGVNCLWLRKTFSTKATSWRLQKKNQTNSDLCGKEGYLFVPYHIWNCYKQLLFCLLFFKANLNFSLFFFIEPSLLYFALWILILGHILIKVAFKIYKTHHVFQNSNFLYSVYYWSLCFQLVFLSRMCIWFALTVLAVAKNPMVLIFQGSAPSLSLEHLNLTCFGSCPKGNHINKPLMKTCKVPVCNRNYLT